MTWNKIREDLTEPAPTSHIKRVCSKVRGYSSTACIDGMPWFHFCWKDHAIYRMGEIQDGGRPEEAVTWRREKKVVCMVAVRMENRRNQQSFRRCKVSFSFSVRSFWVFVWGVIFFWNLEIWVVCYEPPDLLEIFCFGWLFIDVALEGEAGGTRPWHVCGS